MLIFTHIHTVFGGTARLKISANKTSSFKQILLCEFSGPWPISGKICFIRHLVTAGVTAGLNHHTSSFWLKKCVKKTTSKMLEFTAFFNLPCILPAFLRKGFQPPKNGLPNKRRPTNPGALLAFLTSIIDIDPSIRSFRWCCFPRNSPSSQEVRYSMWRELSAWCVRVVGHSHYDCKSIWIIIIYIYIYIYLYIFIYHSQSFNNDDFEYFHLYLSLNCVITYLYVSTNSRCISSKSI